MNKNLAKIQEQINNLLLKEQFRQFLRREQAADAYVVDLVDYTATPNIVACFGQGNAWVVYETDERASVCQEVSFPSAKAAFEDAAKRRGLQFTAKNPLHSQGNLKAALVSAERVAELLSGEPSGEKAETDAALLRRELRRLQEERATTAV